MIPPHFIPLDELSRALRKVLLANPLLKQGRYRDEPGMEGLCYVAAEVGFHLRGGRDSGLKPMVWAHDDGTHWWLEDDQRRILDLNQWRMPSYRRFEYWRGHGQNFLTPLPSERARVTIGLLGEDRPDLVPPRWRS